ncbi:hypothetical protein JOM56_007299 [Amanita muscaria]
MSSTNVSEPGEYQTGLETRKALKRKTTDTELPLQLHEQAIIREQVAEVDERSREIRYMTLSEKEALLRYLGNSLSTSHAVLLRRLKLDLERRRLGLRTEGPGPIPGKVTPLQVPLQNPPVASEVSDPLNSVETTPFENSFLSRIHGAKTPDVPGLIAVDWRTQSPWMDLMCDIRQHYTFTHPEQEEPVEFIAPIEYTILQVDQIPQVHDLLEQSFWSGINVSDSLYYSPEKCTVVAMYKKVVVGVAILSSPQETYIMYLAVKSGWDNSHIARTMLYYLIARNSYKDITLHVSTNNPAMLLYNLFGFKVEEFVAGFYEEYLDPQSRGSKNAFKLRLRQQQ